MRVKIRMIQMILILENGVTKIYWITWNKNPVMLPQKSRNVYHKNPGMYTTKIPECIPQKLSDEDQLLLQNCETALNYTTNYFLVSVMVMLHRLYAISPLLNFRPTNFPTYCNIGPMPAVYFYII